MWQKTDALLRGKMVKLFLPFEKHPTLKNENFKNLYCGDEVFVLETKDGKWARGYALTRPFPNDFTITSTNLDDLPGVDIRVVIFPLKYVVVVEELPLEQVVINREFNNIIDIETVPTIAASELAHRNATDGPDFPKLSNPKRLMPNLPTIRFNKGDDLVDEIKHALSLLANHIFAFYAIGEFKLFTKLVSVFDQLLEVRIKLMNDVLTENEAQVARESATYLLSVVSKKLASKSDRLTDKNYDLDNKNTDVSGYKAILARDSFNGTLFTYDNVCPSRIAINQELCALAPQFPINSHAHKDEYSLDPKPNTKLIHDPPSHILVNFKLVLGSSAYQPPGFKGMTAYMYIRNNRKRLSEAFAVHTDSVKDLVNVEKLSAALFRNIPQTEIENSRVYLCAVLLEDIDISGRSLEQKVTHVNSVKKGVAAGVTDITRVFSKNKGSLQTGEYHQFSIRLFGSYVNNKRPSNNSMIPNMKLGAGDADSLQNNGWGELIERIIAGSSRGIAVNPRAEKLVVSVKEFKHQLQNDGSKVNNSVPIAIIKPIFFDPLADNYERIYLRMGKINLLGNNAQKDDLLTYEISAPNNDLITFAKASNQQEKRSWQFVSVFSGEVVGEIVKINGVSIKSNKKVPKDDYILLSLFVNGQLEGEGKLLYKSGNRLVEYNTKKSHHVEIVSPVHNTQIGLVEVLTEYVGKVFNSDISIDSVFQYDRLFKLGPTGMDDLSAALISICKLDIVQLIKYFPELLSSMYSIVDICLQQKPTPSNEMLEDNCFKAMVHLLDTVLGKQDQYLYMLDTFLTSHKNLPSIGVFLLNKVAEIFARGEANWNTLSRSLCRVVGLVFKLVHESMQTASNTDAYVASMSALFRATSSFLSLQSTSLIGDQVLVLEMIDNVLIFHDKIDITKLAPFVITLVDSIGTRGLGATEDNNSNGKKSLASARDHKIIISKLLLIHRLLGSALAENKATRRILVGKSVSWCMDVFLGSTDVDATRIACSIFNSVCKLLKEKVLCNPDNGNEIDLCFSLAKLLPAISRTFIKFNKYTRGNDFFKPKRTFTYLFPRDYPFKESIADPIVNDEIVVEVLIELVVIFCFVARIGKAAAGNDGYAKILTTKIENDFFDADKYLASNFHNEDVLTLISGVKLMRQGKYFPEDKWLSLYASIADGGLVALELVRPLLINHYIPPIEDSEIFDKTIWGNYLLTLLKLGTLVPVATEHLSEVPQKACFQITSSVRDRIAFMVNEAWDALAWDATKEDTIRFNLNKFGGYQVEFINSDYSILQDLMLFALQKHEACQQVAVKILWSVVISEFILSENIVDVERECLIGLHEIYTRNGYKPMIGEQLNFIHRLKVTIRLDREDIAFGLIYSFINTLQEFMMVLNDLNCVPVGPEFDDDRTFHKLNIFAFLKNANKPELFNSFINAMFEENINKKDYIQAALSLELLASTYSWDHHTLLPSSFRPKFPEQTSFERKETLFKMISHNFIRGNSLERATDTYNELLDAYNAHTYDLKSFAYVHNKLAKLYLDLESSDKLTPSYFRVAFIGAGFPVNTRGKENIYEGLPFEHITSIHERLLKLYPGARIISDDYEAAKIKEKNPTGRYLHVGTVEPINEISDKLFNTSIGVRQYARNKDLRFFTVMKKIPGSTSIFDLWTEETTYETYLSFPTLMNRSEIKESKVIKLSPLDNAIRTIVSKNNDLISLESMINIAFKEKSDFGALINDLSRQLTGTVDSPVNGGVGQYRTFFTDPKYEGKLEHSGQIRLLRNAFDDLTIVLNRCLILHGKLISPSIRMSHEALVDLFVKNFEQEIKALKLAGDGTQSSAASTTGTLSLIQGTSQYSGMISQSGGIHSDKRSISGLSTGGLHAAPLLAGSGNRLVRTSSRASSTSSHSANSHNYLDASTMSGSLNAASAHSFGTNNSGLPGAVNTTKRTALNWRHK